jgi:hypothetical protein
MKITEFHNDPETNDIRAALVTAYGDGEISGDEEFTTNWGGVFKFDLEKLDIGSTEVYNIWILTAHLDKGKINADNHS